MTINILVNGAHGKMGQETVKAVQQDPALTLVGQIGKADDLVAAIKTSKAQVVIDFTTPMTVYENTLNILNAQARPVIGTTGLTAEQIKQLQKICEEKKLGAIIAPNFSIAAILMMQFAQKTARYFPDVEIIELHHPGKLDAPSGTALKTAEMIAQENKISPFIQPTREPIAGSRGALSHGIPIHAVRLPGIVANQEVIFGGMGETLKLCHSTINREAFMPGVLLSCKKVMAINKLIYGLENLL